MTRFPGVSRRSALARSARSVRIPALAVSNSGMVIAAMDVRVDGGYDLDGGTNNIQIAMARTDLTGRVSRDDGASWPHQALIKPGAAGYSTMAVLANGSIGTLCEIGDTGGILFARTTLPWLESRPPRGPGRPRPSPSPLL
ncbi:sialidase family protein [Actinomadura sp. NPDC049382]|uniref:sialidase family protein n=1 Tax=Actinomadura sp. NPDC049382 TaxID=3158220 RepID=UPI003435FB0F